MSNGMCPLCGVNDHPASMRERGIDGSTKCGACGGWSKSNLWKEPKPACNCENGFFVINLELPIIGKFARIVSHECKKCRPNGNHTPISTVEVFENASWKDGVKAVNDLHTEAMNQIKEANIQSSET